MAIVKGEQLTLEEGRVLYHHPRLVCERTPERPCPLHRPSNHKLKNRPIDWVDELKAIVRVCEHDQAHPDPDDLYFKLAKGDPSLRAPIAFLISHPCDGCCGMTARDFFSFPGVYP